MNTDINDLSKKKLNKNKKHDINLLIVSMNKMKIGKKKIVKKNVINNIYAKHELYSLLNKKLFMDEIFGPILFRYFQNPIRALNTISEENNYDADDE